MSDDENGKAIVLSAREAAFVREALASVSALLDKVRADGGPCLELLEETALEVVYDGRPLKDVRGDVSQAIDWIDFAWPARLPARHWARRTR